MGASQGTESSKGLSSPDLASLFVGAWQSMKAVLITLSDMELQQQEASAMKKQDLDRSTQKDSTGVADHLEGLEMWSPNRAPADRDVSIKDSGFTRPGLDGTVLCLHTATSPGREGVQKCGNLVARYFDIWQNI